MLHGIYKAAPTRPNEPGSAWQPFEDVKHELKVGHYDAAKGYQPAKHNGPDFTLRDAAMSGADKYQWGCHGQIKFEFEFQESR